MIRNPIDNSAKDVHNDYMKRIAPFILFLLVFSVVPTRAYYDQDVLGTATQVNNVVFPAVTFGPGFILPDSPLYSLDKLYQQIRLALVFTPENRAQLHTQIAGERLAELRVMTSRNNQVGIDIALLELQREALAAANELKDAASQGKDVTQLARTIHQTLADYRTVVNTAKSQVPDTAYGQKLATAADVLWEAKLISEDALPPDDLENEIAVNIREQLNEEVMGIATSTLRLEKKLSIYEKLASKAAEQAVKRQQEQLAKEALKEKQKELIAQRKKAIEEYLARTEQLRKQREQELAQLKKTIKELQEQLRQLNQSATQGSSSGTVTITPKPLRPIKNTLQIPK